MKIQTLYRSLLKACVRKISFAWMLILALAAPVYGEQVFHASEGFSDLQGSKGWYYGSVHHTGVKDLYANEEVAEFNIINGLWEVRRAGIRISATAQNKTEGNANFSLRIWQALQDYQKVEVESLLEGTTLVGGYLAYVDAATHATTQIGQAGWVTQGLLDRNDGHAPVRVNAVVTDVKKGDRIYFILRNSGQPQTTPKALQAWDQVVTAYP